MAVFKCKMCGGTLEVKEGTKICECEYCGSEQTIPSVNEENLQNLFNRANILRMKAEFDKAADVYERIIQADGTDAEAYWGLVLCKYGVEYVEDPVTLKRVPTCHRTSYDAVVADEDYRKAIECADIAQKNIYEAEAKAIDEIQKGILDVASSESPYDVFICYKEADESGKRTVDSVIANDIYHQLTQEGFKVFYAAITLEEKLGSEYEPYIFSALNSAKVMLVLGTKPEYFDAVWVKNEWSRFMKLMRNDRSRTLIPCYRDMDAYELPEEFAHLQAQDMSKIGFISDIIRGIKKLVATPEKTEKKTSESEAVRVRSTGSGAINIDALLKRASLSLDDCDWKKADEFCEQVLNVEPENAQAYLGKMLAELHVRSMSELHEYKSTFDHLSNYKKTVRFCDETLREELETINKNVREENETRYKNDKYGKAEQKLNSATKEKDFLEAAKLFEEIIPWKDSDVKSQKAYVMAEEARKDNIYNEAIKKMETTQPQMLSMAVDLFTSISDWKDASTKAKESQDKIDELLRLEEEKQKQLEIEKREKKNKRNKTMKIAAISIASIIVIVSVLGIVVTKSKEQAMVKKYEQAQEYLDNKEYENAIALFTELGDYEDASEKLATAEQEFQYYKAEQLFSSEEYEEAIVILSDMEEYAEAETMLIQCINEIANAALSEQNVDIEVLSAVSDDFYEAHSESCYIYAQALFNEAEWELATTYFTYCSGFEQADNYNSYAQGRLAIEQEDYEEAINEFSTILAFLDSSTWLGEATYQFVMTDYSSIAVDDILNYLQQSTDLSDSSSELLEFCESLLECEGQYKCYQKIKEDGSISTNDIAYWITLTFYFYKGEAYVNVINSLFHDTTLYDGLVEDGNDGYTYEAHCATSKSSKQTENFYFSANEAKYSGDVSSNIFYYSK